MEAAAPDVITISDSESDEEEKYLKIYYPNSSTKCIEIPLADDGSLSFAYIKAMIPNIFTLNLMKDEISRLYLPTNDCFKEPKEKWNSFRVVAVLMDSSSTTASSSNNNVSTRTDSTDKLQLHTAPTTDGTSINNEPTTSTTESAAKKTPQIFGTSFQDKYPAATKGRNTVPHPQPIDPSLPSSSVQSININESVPPLNNDVVADENQLPNLSCGPQNREIKKELIPKTQIIDVSPSSVQSINTSSNINEPSDNSMEEVTDAQVFAAYNVTSISQLKDLLCQGNYKFKKSFGAIFKTLKRTMIAYPNKDFVKLFYYAWKSCADLKMLDSNAPESCDLCDTRFTIRHLVFKEHVRKYQSKFNKDPPEISFLFDFKNRAQIITPSLLTRTGENIYNFFINKFYPKMQVEFIKDNLVNRVTTAQLKLPFEDPLLIEKLIFFKRSKHPENGKDIFPADMICKSCSKELKSSVDNVNHILGVKHLRYLTQEELDKLIEAVSIIDYSDNGFFYKPLNESRKRNYQETMDENAVITSDITAVAKRQRND